MQAGRTCHFVGFVMRWLIYQSLFITYDAYIGVLGMWNICLFTSSVIGYLPFYLHGYGILLAILHRLGY